MVFTAHLGYQTEDSPIIVFRQYRRFPNTQKALNSVLEVIYDIILASNHMFLIIILKSLNV